MIDNCHISSGLSIHFPLTREDSSAVPGASSGKSFQSTSLSRGKTTPGLLSTASVFFQSTSLSRGKTLLFSYLHLTQFFQSTSLSRGKTCGERIPCLIRSFQSTSLSRGKTNLLGPIFNHSSLSIHFPLTREDIIASFNTTASLVFQSTSLSRGKTIVSDSHPSLSIFQSTSLSRGKTMGSNAIRI